MVTVLKTHENYKRVGSHKKDRDFWKKKAKKVNLTKVFVGKTFRDPRMTEKGIQEEELKKGGGNKLHR